MILAFDTIITNFYFYIAIGFSTFFILQTIFTFIGLGDSFDFDADFDAEVDLDINMADGVGMALHLFSIRGIIAFFMLFGWTGYILSLGDLHDILVFIIAFIAGSIMLILVGLIYYFLMKISQDGNLILTDAIGKEGSVYIPIPNRNEGIGKIQIVVGESLRTLDAIAKDKSIKTGQQVTVVGIVNGMLEVEENK